MMRLIWLASVVVVLAAPAAATSPPFERRTLANGAVLLVSEQRAVPMVDIEILVDAGSRRDPRGKEGLAQLTADLLNEGTERYTASELAEAVDRLGASLSTHAGIDYASLNLRALSKHLDSGIELLSEVLLRPTFAREELDRRVEAVLASMRAAEDNPGWLAYRAFVDEVFDDEPYGHLSEGTAEAVASIRREDVTSFFTRHYAPQGAIVTVVGDVAADDVQARLERAWSSWRRAADHKDLAYPEPSRSAAGVTVIRKPLSQTNILLGHRGIERKHPDYYAVEVMNHILGGGGFGSRLVDRIRTRGGLAYSVGSGFSTPQFPGSFRVSMQTKSDSTLEAIRLVCDELRRIRLEPVSAEELEAAKLYLTGNFPLQLDSNGQVAGLLASPGFLDLGDRYAEEYVRRIQAVSADDVQRAARQHVRPEDLRLVLVGDTDWDRSTRSPTVCAPAGSEAPTES